MHVFGCWLTSGCFIELCLAVKAVNALDVVISINFTFSFIREQHIWFKWNHWCGDIYIKGDEVKCMFLQLLPSLSYAHFLSLCTSKAPMKIFWSFFTALFDMDTWMLYHSSFLISPDVEMMQQSIFVLLGIWTLWKSYFFFGFQQWGYLNILCKTKYHSKVLQPLDDSSALSDRTGAKKHTCAHTGLLFRW